MLWLVPERFCLVLLLCLFAVKKGAGFSITKEDVPGIWKLSLSEGAFPLAPPQTEEDLFRSKLLARDERSSTSERRRQPEQNGTDEILLKVNPDGTFRQCSEGYQEGCWIAGRWKLKADGALLLAFDRQYYGPQRDTLLEGILQQEKVNSTTNRAATTSKMSCIGDVFSGKFCYPKQHPAFFDEPIAASMKNRTGSFSLEQAVATYSVVSSSTTQNNASESDESPIPYKKSDFYGRKFFMTVEPLILTRSLSQQDIEIVKNLPVDIRAMPIEFYSNSTFQAFGTNKILRGRFDILAPSEKRDRYELWFQVSLFGAGRSAPGSVYSEGLGLSHHDKQSYVGEIVAMEKPDGSKRLFVGGSVTFGSELGADARSEPVAHFQLVENSADDQTVSLQHDDEDDVQDDLNNSVFE